MGVLSAGLLISKRDDPPTHYIFKIENFSLLSKNSIEKYESSDFESGGYKWKLAFYPNGNKEKEVKDHISLYLVMADTTSLPIGWEVNVNLRLFMFDQKRDEYVTIEGWNSRHFHALKTEWGFSQLIPLTTLQDPSNGYLVDDTCVFGADVIVLKRATKGECLSMLKDVTPYKHTWRVCGFSTLTGDVISDVFVVGGKKWRIQLDPMGDVNGKKDGYISIFLVLNDSKSLFHAEKFYVKFKILILQSLGKHMKMLGKLIPNQFDSMIIIF
ncbi:Ubiquitin carboxyl-terminal hydrolase [Thalictrum thalictroides]|uniref:Ubiquitin carboxyl-terminal hydrolase n=1 Tax=Thalictrum thalictroides TaxID=46969 RepID=A0A7J6VXK3_THATH|nr:Ubiquitin carboxyl-terminal hydrolase [Thalictrum thalictroides]